MRGKVKNMNQMETRNDFFISSSVLNSQISVFVGAAGYLFFPAVTGSRII